MAHRKARVPRTPSDRSNAIPACTVHLTPCQKDEKGNWFCLTCADEWLREYVINKTGKKTEGGVELPLGVVDPRKLNPTFRDLMPNRATRRRLRRA